RQRLQAARQGIQGLVAQERASVVHGDQDHRPPAEELAEGQLAARVVAEPAVQRQPNAQLLVEADAVDGRARGVLVLRAGVAGGGRREQDDDRGGQASSGGMPTSSWAWIALAPGTCPRGRGHATRSSEAQGEARHSEKRPHGFPPCFDSGRGWSSFFWGAAWFSAGPASSRFAAGGIVVSGGASGVGGGAATLGSPF